MTGFNIFTVSDLNRHIKNSLDNDKLLSELYIKGEISNFTNHIASGHFYFSLKDDKAAVKAVMFRSNAQRLAFTPKNGMTVILRGSVSVFERDGVYQVYAVDMQPDGVGALYLAYQQLKEKLEREGLFDARYKKPIPVLPEKIGVVTSQTGAVLQDIINVLSRRYPIAKIVICPVNVQGEFAEGQLVAAVESLNRQQACDVLIIGRGGGSIEDLWAFNSEALARAVFASQIPVVSAVGHETDFTICDFVADLRAPTPSAAAELVSADVRDIEYTCAKSVRRIQKALSESISYYEDKLGHFSPERLKRRCAALTERYSERLDACLRSANMMMGNKLESSRLRLEKLTTLIKALSPMAVVERGFAVVYDGETVVKKAADVQIGQALDLMFADGKVGVKAEKVELA